MVLIVIGIFFYVYRTVFEPKVKLMIDVLNETFGKIVKITINNVKKVVSLFSERFFFYLKLKITINNDNIIFKIEILNMIIKYFLKKKKQKKNISYQAYDKNNIILVHFMTFLW